MNPSKFFHIKRKVTSVIMMSLSLVATLIALVPLVFIFYYTISKGISYLNIDFFIAMPKPVGETGGGMANAIAGTLLLIGIGGVIGIPVGVMTGTYLSEFGNNKFGSVVRFLTDVLSGVPSIVVGVVAYTLVVIPMKHFSALAGGIALGILMIPTITRTTEEMIKLVPHSLREAGLALGIPKWKTTILIVLKTAWKGIATGILLGLSRAAGETAPLLFTALGNRFWSTKVGQPIASLSVYIYDYAKAPFEDWNQQAWTAALVLMLMISILSLTFRIVTRSKYKTK
ncbi:MAG: phosphate ABC transporter, permease protein PstA [Ignavibacteria bacterium CG_4_8_14_3_um_filter_37_9]|nr:phosphate ABC transporter permease PstA [Ignavibacteria bacterium]OIO18648.1 MAG: phosphate ABC transporter, permease protein PstA [Ignavibacteria bacterium CG1_02_37_35]PIP79530.1 MAG: phosphate ABC transporter, permease protein PstA [Ignavibacteria bacterium CG22_combo_CG10-13_8_21_14_all_37_15]PIS45749.1 MAG: phosphate ABC transporter, permease protein PstA [Ignavibacteria bacterium CG08_land_8_20_14_0_20_37_9]PIW99501.1 MAG: phosphate ABC transporter, permease protein PstA [Ignavibacteri